MAETVGSLVDKISILTLKVYHMEGQTLRTDASAEHKEASGRKLQVLRTQLADLKSELNELTNDVLAGRKTLRVYRQFKMYNDPVYRSKGNS